MTPGFDRFPSLPSGNDETVMSEGSFHGVNVVGNGATAGLPDVITINPMAMIKRIAKKTIHFGSAFQ